MGTAKAKKVIVTKTQKGISSDMKSETASLLSSMIPELQSKAYLALLSGETIHNIEQALESELIHFLQVNGENESLQLVVDFVLKSLLDGVGAPGTFNQWQVSKS